MKSRTPTIINQQFFKYMIPTTLLAMTSGIGTAVDSIVVGNLLGAQALAVVMLVMPLTFVLNACCILLGVGGSTLFSIALGAGVKQKQQDYFSTTVVLMMVFSMLFCILGLLLEPYIIGFLVKDAKELEPLIAKYIKITILSSPLMLLGVCLNYFFRSIGKTTFVAVMVIISNVVNLIMDILYIKFMGMGVGGAALATGTGHFVSLVAIVLVLLKTKELRLRKISGNIFETLREILKTGAPQTINMLLLTLQLFCINALIISNLGGKGIEVFSICNAFFSLITMFAGGVMATMPPFLGVLYGEKDVQAIHFTIKRTIFFAMWTLLPILLLVELFPGSIALFFGVTQPDMVASIAFAVRIYALELPFMAFILIAEKVYQTTEQLKLATFISVLDGFVSVVLVAWILVHTVGALYIWFAFPIGMIITLVILLITVRVIQKKDSRRKGIFLLNLNEQHHVLDVTMIQSNDQAAQLSGAAIEFCTQHKISASIANRVGVVLEEMTVNTIAQKTKHKKESYIDVRLVLDEEEIRIIFKDNGGPYNPLIEREDTPSFGNIAMVLALANTTEYDSVLGMNRTIVKINKVHSLHT